MYERPDTISQYIRQLHNFDISTTNSVIYIGTNESRLRLSRERLSADIARDGSCHIGCSGWHNFDIMVLRKSKRAIIFDINPQQVKFMKMTLQLLCQHDNRINFVDHIIAYAIAHNSANTTTRLENNLTPLSFFSPNVSDDASFKKLIINDKQDSHHWLYDDVKFELDRIGSWLQNDDSFNWIRALVLADRIAVIVEDICNTDKFVIMRQFLRDNNIEVDTIYLSNISDFMNNTANKKKYVTTLHVLMSPDTIIVHCPITSNNCILCQQTITGADLVQRNSYFKKIENLIRQQI